MNLETRIAIETAIATRVIKDAIASGFYVSVNDGEETTLVRSQDKDAILAAMFSTDGDNLRISRKTPESPKGWTYVGSVSFIYGNTGWDVIADHTDSDKIDDLLRGANRLSDQVEAHLGDDAAILRVLEMEG